MREKNKENSLKIDFPEMLAGLFEPYRYKILYGGRGGMKSHSIARALLLQGMSKALRILCARELQKSIKDSVHRLLSDLITELHLESFYEVQTASIKGKNGTEFFFEGLRHNTNQIKSYEGADKVWVEEAATVSKSSWDYLIPTIRKDNSEIWISFNPELEEDETYQRFIINPPQSAYIQKVNYTDNIWLNDVLKAEAEALKARDPESYKNIWKGYCRKTIEGAIYAREIEQAIEENRITVVPHNSQFRVNTFWDLGWADNTSIWFIQKVGFQYLVIDFYQNSHQSIQHYVKVLQDKKYIYEKHYLPHDARQQRINANSIENTMSELGCEVDIVPKLDIADGIQAVRTIFPSLYFDKDKCADGLQALRRYRYDVNKDTGRISREPLHDENSHASDALRYFASTPSILWESLIERKGWGDSHGVSGKVLMEYNPFENERVLAN